MSWPHHTIVAGLAAAAMLVLHARAGQTPLPRCDSVETRVMLAAGLDVIPAFAGRNAELLDLERIASRGAKGRRRLRACQAWLVTDQGGGMLEYSIRESRGRDHAYAVRAELFQGGWRDRLDEQVSSGDASNDGPVIY